MKHLAIAVLIVLGVGTAVLGGAKFYVASQARAAHAAAEREQAALRDRIATLSAQHKAAEERAAMIEADNALLAAQVGKTRAAKVAAAAKPAPVSRATAEQRIDAARNLGDSGDPEKALIELLWCWDEGIGLLDSPRQVSRRLRIGRALAQLAERHPPALAAMRERWTTARARFLEVGDVDGVLGQFTSLTQALGEKGAVLALYDQIPDEDSRRRLVGIHVFGELVEGRRYKDAFAVRDGSGMLQTFELQSNMSSLPQMRDHALTTAAQNLEVLAGAGELAPARELIERILKFDSTPSTRDLLRKHLQRAGKPGLLDAAEGSK